MLYKCFTPSKGPKQKVSGFTLVELIIGIVVLSLSFTVIFSMVVPSATHSAKQIHQIRASELGKAMLNEIMGKAFDENSNMTGGNIRCGEDIDSDNKMESVGEIECTLDEKMGNEEDDKRSLFDDVDDYNGLTEVQNSFGDSLSDIYKGFTLSVKVCNDSQYDGNCDGGDNQIAKLITITVTTAQGESVTFASYKTNF